MEAWLPLPGHLETWGPNPGGTPPPTPVVRGLPLVIMELPQREQEPRNPSYFPLPGQWSRPVCEWSEKPCSSIKDWMGLGPMQRLADPPV